MLKTLCDDTKSNCLRLCSSLFKCLTISHNAREFWNLGDPAPIFFLFSFNNKVHKLLPSKLSFSLYHIGVGIQFCARLTNTHQRGRAEHSKYDEKLASRPPLHAFVRQRVLQRN